MINSKIFQGIKKIIPKSIWPRIKNASYLSIGQLFSQLISFLSIPFITRKLGVEEYGVYATVGAFVGMFTLLNLKGLAKVLVREGSRDLTKLKKSIESITGIQILLTIISIIASILGALLIKNYDKKTIILIAIYSLNLIPLNFRSILSAYYQAVEQMQYIAIFSVSQKLLFSVTAIIVVLAGGGVLGLVIVNVVSGLLILITNYIHVRKKIRFSLLNPLIFDKEILSPILMFTLLGFLGFLATKIDIVMISWLGTKREVGLYAVAFSLLNYAGMFRSQVSDAFFPMFVKRTAKHGLEYSKIFKIFFLLLIIGLIIAFLISRISDYLIILIFGKEFSEAGKILSLLIYYLTVGYASLPLTNSLLANNKEKAMLFVGFWNALFNVALNYLLYKRYGLIGIAYSTLIVYGVIYPINIIGLMLFQKRKSNNEV